MKYLLLLLVVGSCFAQDSTKYNRKDWKHWIDADNDCQNTRNEVLIEESTVPVEMDANNCKVLSGRWICPFTGMVITNPNLLDIDHMVPLKEAHESGGWKWSKEMKMLYANDLTDPVHLVAVYRGANRSKKDKSPDEWLPKNKYARCLYIIDWVRIKSTYELRMTETENKFIANYLAENCMEKQ